MLTLTRHVTIDSFLSAALPMMLEREAESNFPLGHALYMQELKSPIGTTYLVTVEDGSTTLLAGVGNVQRRLTPIAIPDLPPFTVELVMDDMATLDLGMPDILCPTTLADMFDASWKRRTERSSRIVKNYRLFGLQSVVWPKPASGNLRQATISDIAAGIELGNAFLLEALPELDFRHNDESMRRVIEEGELFVWDDGGVVATAVVIRPTTNCSCIGGVYTPPDLRGKGYASNCVAYLSQQILDSGKRFSILHTDLKNPTSNKIYQELGYEPVCDFRHYSFKT